eukprot:gene392-52_t
MVSFRVTEWYGTFFVLDFILGSVCLCRFLLRKAVDAVFGSLGVGGGYVSQLTLIVLAAYLLVLPLWELVVPDEYPMSNRYIPQEDVEDELEDAADNPVSYQVWRGGKLVFASVRKNDVRAWVSDEANVRRTERDKVVIREVQL